MTIKKLLNYGMLSLTLVSLSACSLLNQNKKSATDTTTSASQLKPENEAWRLNFNNITLGDIANEGKGGASLADLKNLYGEPENHTTRPGGDVTLDVYTWRKGQTTVVAQLYNDSTIAKSISNFRFIRKDTVGLKDFEKLTNGMTFTNVTSLLGEPDVMSRARSSNGEVVTAIWSSGLKSDNSNPNIELEFNDDKLSTKSQFGLKN